MQHDIGISLNIEPAINLNNIPSFTPTHKNWRIYNFSGDAANIECKFVLIKVKSND